MWCSLDGDREDIGDEEVKLECSVMLQKENPDGLKDEECGRPVEDGNAGLCVYVRGRKGGRGGGREEEREGRREEGREGGGEGGRDGRREEGREGGGGREGRGGGGSEGRELR